ENLNPKTFHTGSYTSRKTDPGRSPETRESPPNRSSFPLNHVPVKSEKINPVARELLNETTTAATQGGIAAVKAVPLRSRLFGRLELQVKSILENSFRISKQAGTAERVRY
ncbi:MAG TPA: hypothetical protein PLA90_18700, partial [Candidatus Sumerlaeota bacterium]|nr:hypothetical protein [Candidatus Sumerlaeota bacterium]